MASVSRSRQGRNQTRQLDPKARLGRLRTYSVTNLFGRVDYRFDLDRSEPTLLTGVNGTGKSTILRTIEIASTGDIRALIGLPFSKIDLTFDTGKFIRAEKRSDLISFELSGEEPWEVRIDSRLRHLLQDDDELSAAYDLILRDPGSHSARALRNRLAHSSADMLLRELLSGEWPSWIRTLPDRFPVLFITDQRLILERPGGKEARPSEQSTRVAADEAAKNVAQEIAFAKAAYANRSQALDRDFPQRVIKAMTDSSSVSDEQLRFELKALSEQRKALEAVGLLPIEVTDEFGALDLTAANVRAVIATYVSDTKRKLQVLEDVRLKLSLFSDFLNQHYDSKRIQIDSERGFIIVSNDDSTVTPLPPSKLSSGEQQMMVLAHHILFKSDAGTLVLIDEPELSLHVLWQSTFIEDLAEMGRVGSLQFLLATHSPSLIGGREDLKRSLDTIGRN